MGHSTCGRHGARTCDRCDKCPKCYEFRMTIKSCPVGWCGVYHLCPECKHVVIEHESCRRSSAQHEVWNAQRKIYYAQGIPVRCSAMGVGKVGMVHVLFADSDNKGRNKIGFYMHKTTYDALPLVEPHTPDDYRRFGELTPAPSDYVWECAS
jgi:hypothetical protein